MDVIFLPLFLSEFAMSLGAARPQFPHFFFFLLKKEKEAKRIKDSPAAFCLMFAILYFDLK